MEVFSVPLCQSRRSTVSVWLNTFGITEAHHFHPNLIVLQETSSLTKKFPGLSKGLLELELILMIEAVSRFPEGKEPRLHGNLLRYVIHDRKITYINAESGVSSTVRTYGYTTFFTYFMEYEKGNLTSENIKKYVNIEFVCGGLLYSMIPTYYDFCLDMTGTLDCLTDSQNSFLQD
jgi:hypothetical protein